MIVNRSDRKLREELRAYACPWVEAGHAHCAVMVCGHSHHADPAVVLLREERVATSEVLPLPLCAVIGFIAHVGGMGVRFGAVEAEIFA